MLFVEGLPLGQIALLCLLKFSEAVASFLIFPFVNEMIIHVGVTDDPRRVGYYSGFIESLFFLTQFCTVLFWSSLSDRVGRRPILLMGLLGVALSSLTFGLAKSFPTMVIARGISGTLNGNAPVIKSAVAELSTTETESIAFSVLGLAWALASLVAPTIGGFLARPAEQFPIKVLGVPLVVPHWMARSLGVEDGSTGERIYFRTFFARYTLFGSKIFVEYPYLLPCAAGASISLGAFICGAIWLEETLPAKVQENEEREERKRMEREDEIREELRRGGVAVKGKKSFVSKWLGLRKDAEERDPLLADQEDETARGRYATYGATTRTHSSVTLSPSGIDDEADDYLGTHQRGRGCAWPSRSPSRGRGRSRSSGCGHTRDHTLVDQTRHLKGRTLVEDGEGESERIEGMCVDVGKTNTETTSMKSQPSTAPPLSKLLKDPYVTRTLLSYTLFALVGIALEAIWVLWLFTPPKDGGIGMTSAQIALTLLATGVISTILGLAVFPFLQKRWGTRRIFLWCLAMDWLMCIGFCIVGSIGRWEGGISGFWSYLATGLGAPGLQAYFGGEIGEGDEANGGLPNDRVFTWGGVWVMVLLKSLGEVAYLCTNLLINASAPSRSSLGAVNGVAQMIASLMRACGPVGATSLFALTMSHNIMNGQFVWACLAAVAGVAFLSGLRIMERDRSGWNTPQSVRTRSTASTPAGSGCGTPRRGCGSETPIVRCVAGEEEDMLPTPLALDEESGLVPPNGLPSRSRRKSVS